MKRLGFNIFATGVRKHAVLRKICHPELDHLKIIQLELAGLAFQML